VIVGPLGRDARRGKASAGEGVMRAAGGFILTRVLVPFALFVTVFYAATMLNYFVTQRLVDQVCR
jgi:hypothetical protein